MSDLGSDFHCVTDLTPDLSRVDGRVALGQAVARRLLEIPGGLFYDENYGLGVERWLNAPIVASRVQSAVVAEAVKDERVETAKASVVFIEATGQLSIQLELDDGDGPFSLTLGTDGVTSELLITGDAQQ